MEKVLNEIQKYHSFLLNKLKFHFFEPNLLTLDTECSQLFWFTYAFIHYIQPQLHLFLYIFLIVALS